MSNGYGPTAAATEATKITRRNRVRLGEVGGLCFFVTARSRTVVDSLHIAVIIAVATTPVWRRIARVDPVALLEAR